MVMRSQSKEKALANLTSKFMSHNDQPVNCPFAWMHCWSNESKFDYFSCILRPFVSYAYGCLEKNGRQIQASYSNSSRSHSTQVTYVMKTHQIKIAICYFSDFVHKILPYRKLFPSEHFRGKQTGTFRVTKGGPLPFAVDIVAPTLKYGFKCFMKYPADIPDYFKQAFPEGLTYDRKLTFEDGGCATATVEMK